MQVNKHADTGNAGATHLRLAELRRNYIAQLPDKIRQVEDALSALDRKWDAEEADRLAGMLHMLAGSSGTFGLSGMQAAARAMECGLRGRLATGSYSPDFPSLMTALALSLKEPDTAPDDAEPRQEAGLPSGGEVIYIVEDDPLVAHDLALPIGHSGYGVETFSRPGDLAGAVQKATPAAIVMDLGFPEGRLAGAEIVAKIQEGRERPIPVLFLSGRGDFEARLSAVRAGGDAYFTKPVDAGRLLDRLDILTKRQPPEPLRILIVDDEPEAAFYHEAILQQAGMATSVVTDPLEAMESLASFRPELLLMDVYMPGCNGLELAKVIRQNEAFIDIPIVFLSCETDIDKRLNAMSRGGDDFLSKPIQPPHLVLSVTHRAERYRILRAFMIRDGLTGLLNHTRIREHLDLEVARAKRQGSSCALAMIDLDQFKAVNDAYGHPAGDRVIRSLSRLLKQRLRKTDAVGRYGGEEFAVILGGADAEQAETILNEIRVNFSKIRHHCGDREFAVTFSCGIAAHPAHERSSELIEASDRALYEAKRSGRNRVVCAPAALPE